MPFFRNFDIHSYLIRILVLFLSISVHEWAHAYSAFRYGDDTAARQGRMTLNPLVHFEPIGLMLILFGAPIAWAKPVPVNTRKFHPHVNYAKATLVVALSGITCNFILAFIGSFLYYFVSFIMVMVGPGAVLWAGLNVIKTFGLMMLLTNVFLAIFNLLPIPQLDGFELWSRFMPAKWVSWIWNHAHYINIAILIIILFFNRGFGIVLNVLAKPFLFILQWPWKTLFNLLLRIFI
jgi:Zn-dependent protease